MKYFSDFLVGKSHLRKGDVCQDRCDAGVSNGVTFLTVADGLGAYSKSDLGADLAIKLVGREVTLRFDKFLNDPVKMSKLTIKFIQSKFNEYADKCNLNEKELSTTLSFVLIKDGKYIAFSVGDSPIVIINKDGSNILIKESKKNWAVNETIPVNSSLALETFNLNIGEIECVDKILLFTDGCDFLCENIEALRNTSIDDNNDFKQFLKFTRDSQTDDVAICYLEF